MINRYQLACGAVDQVKTKRGKVEIYMEHNHYHVKRFSYFIDETKTINDAWLVFDNYNDAKKAFNRQVNILKGI